MDEPIATLADYRARVDDGAQDALVEVFLADASAFVLAQLPSGWESDASVLANLKRVVCSVAARAVASRGSDAYESVSQTAGPYSMTLKPINPSGDMYLTAQEKASLHIGGSFGFSAPYRRGAARDD